MTAAELNAHCVRELDRYKTPSHLRFVMELPKGPSGKVQRMNLAEGFGMGEDRPSHLLPHRP